MTRQEAVVQADNYFTQLKIAREELIEQREKDISSRYPAIDALLRKRAALPVNSLKKALLEPSRAAEISDVMCRSGQELNAQIRDELVKNGYGEDWLNPAYHCPKCRDTGYIFGSIPAKPCKCFDDKVSELMLRKCEGIQVEQSILRRILNYGTLLVTTGEVTNRYKKIKDPVTFSTRINEQIDELRGNA